MNRRFRRWFAATAAALALLCLGGCGEPLPPPDGGEKPPVPAAQFYDNMERAEGWGERECSLTVHDGVATVQNASANKTYGSVTKRMTVNTVDYPYVEFGIDRISSGGRWALNINAGGGEFSVYSERGALGIFSVDLRKWPELREQSNLTVMLCFYACGDAPGSDTNYDISFLKTESFSPFAETFDTLDNWTLTGLTGSVTDGVAFLEGNGSMETTFWADFRHWTSFDLQPYQMDGSFSVSLFDEAGAELPLGGPFAGEAARKLTVAGLGRGSYRLRIAASGSVSFDSVALSATTLFADDFSDEEASMARWEEVTARLDVMTEGERSFARLTEGAGKAASGYIQAPVYIDAGLFKYVRVTVLRLDPGTTWALKAFYNGSEVTVYNGSGRPGTYYAELSGAGISGNAKFELRLYVIGNEKSADFGGIAITSERSSS